ncbi:MAG: 2-C-methyl-D-erythritol 4-phosphate cytidylyltransferase [candidate division Zixibacteria bacterium]|nr:2-C-methyl-D-erythritol 4-phosphate cytidylyltransferase [candidate division Zixibacteria bacterium]
MATPSSPRIAVIIAAAGSGARLGGDIPKPWRLLNGQSLVERAWRSFCPESLHVERIVLAVDAPYLPATLEFASASLVPLHAVAGGATRTASVRHALREIPDSIDLVAVHDAARPFWPVEIWADLVDAAVRVGGSVPAVAVSDTLKRVQGSTLETVDRAGLWAVQTPQMFRADLLHGAHEAAQRDGIDATDDAELVRRVGGATEVVPSSAANFKITTAADWALAEHLSEQGNAPMAMRIGFGYDAHRLGGPGPLMLGGVRLADSGGLIGHSDGDALLHALCDALLGAAALRDIGHHFPPDDPRFKGCDSRELVRETVQLLRVAGFAPAQADATVLAEHPRLAPHVTAMCTTIAADLGLDPGRVSVKATTTEGMGFVGRGEGIAAQVVATVLPIRQGTPR